MDPPRHGLTACLSFIPDFRISFPWQETRGLPAQMPWHSAGSDAVQQGALWACTAFQIQGLGRQHLGKQEQQG